MTDKAEVLRGAATLTEMLDLIGDTESDDHAAAKLLVENELQLRALLGHAIKAIAEGQP